MENQAREKTVMCFGDSNTWGADPSGGIRFDRATRWPGVLQAELGPAYHVVEEGLCGRTTVWDDPVEGDKNGIKQMVPLIHSHEPLDLLIIMLGTNDLKNRYSVSALDVANSLVRMAKLAKTCVYPFLGSAPEVLIVCPPPFAPLEPTDFEEMFVGGEAKSHQLAGRVRQVCAEKGIRMMNAGDFIASSPLDGIHFEASEHEKLGKAVAEEVREIL